MVLLLCLLLCSSIHVDSLLILFLLFLSESGRLVYRVRQFCFDFVVPVVGSMRKTSCWTLSEKNLSVNRIFTKIYLHYKLSALHIQYKLTDYNCLLLIHPTYYKVGFWVIGEIKLFCILCYQNNKSI